MRTIVFLGVYIGVPLLWETTTLTNLHHLLTLSSRLKVSDPSGHAGCAVSSVTGICVWSRVWVVSCHSYWLALLLWSCDFDRGGMHMACFMPVGWDQHLGLRFREHGIKSCMFEGWCSSVAMHHHTCQGLQGKHAVGNIPLGSK